MKHRRKTYLSCLFVICLVLLLGACSSQGNSNNGEPEQSADSGNTGGETADNGAAKFPRTIKDANGEVTIEKEPKKVAVVHWGYTDSILLFDVPSVAVVLPFTEKQSAMNTEVYKPYVDKLEELAVVGENTEVNLEALLAYGPDLIIAGNTVNEKVEAELKKIAATVVIDEAEINVWGDWQPLVTKFGEILGQEEQAAKYLADFQSQIGSAKEKLADVEGNVAFLQVRADAVWLQGTDYLSLYYGQLGLKAPEGDAMKEGAQLSLEGLSALNPDHLVLGYFNQIDTSLAALTDEWEKSEVWKKLKAVQSGQVYSINGELALGYGPLAHQYGLNAIVEALK